MFAPAIREWFNYKKTLKKIGKVMQYVLPHVHLIYSDFGENRVFRNPNVHDYSLKDKLRYNER